MSSSLLVARSSNAATRSNAAAQAAIVGCTGSTYVWPKPEYYLRSHSQTFQL